MNDYAFAALVLILVMLCIGDPDILDGLIKMANR